MKKEKFSQEQILVIEQLTVLLQQCQQLNIHIAGVTAFEVKTHTDSEGKEYLSIT